LESCFNLKFWDEPIAAQYGVESIPATFILDASGKMSGKRFKGDELRGNHRTFGQIVGFFSK
jgi:hypothetical protein